MSDTPRTDANIIDACWIIASHSTDNFVRDRYARQLERELNKANKLITQLTTDVNYEGGVQYWLKKHDELLVKLATINKQARIEGMKEAAKLVKSLIGYGPNYSGLVNAFESILSAINKLERNRL